MSMKRLAALLEGVIPPGLYRFSSRAQPATIQAAAEQHGWRYFYIDGGALIDKATFLRQFAATLEFPAYFGQNWDAFEEIMTDSHWPTARGYLIVYDDVANFATNAPQDWATALAILQAVVADWQSLARPLAILLRNVGKIAPALPKL
jgi:RNAse (barnase) inhibitor barstar